MSLAIGVLALQGGFYEHLNLLRRAVQNLGVKGQGLSFKEVRNAQQLVTCDALIIPGGESTTMAIVAARSGLLEPLREFVKVHKKPVWGTCAGLIFLAEEVHDAKKGGQELIGGLSVRVHRNHFGRQVESFITALDLPFLQEKESEKPAPFSGVFIRAPIVEALLPGLRDSNGAERSPVEVMGILPGRRTKAQANEHSIFQGVDAEARSTDVGDVIAVKQDNIFGTSFHPELTDDARIHLWWLREVLDATGR